MSELTLSTRPVPPARKFAWRRYRLLIIGGLMVGLVFFAAIFAPWITPYSPYDLNVNDMLQPPSPDHWLGTDEFGRDVLSRTIYAARISLQVASSPSRSASSAGP